MVSRLPALALVVMLVVVGAVQARAAAGPTGAQAALSAIVRSDSVRYDPAVASRIVSTRSGELALVAYYSTTDHHAYSAIYRYARGRWRLLARVSPGEYAGPPDPRHGPALVHLTGAIDFLVRMETANEDGASVISDVGGRWHAVPFKGAAVSGAPGPQTEAQYVSVHGTRIRTGLDDCNPFCSAGKIIYTTWFYDPAARAFTRVHRKQSSG